MIVKPASKTLKLDATTLYGNGLINATITTGFPAPAGGLNVSLSATNGTGADSVNVPEGATFAVIPVLADDVTSTVPLTVTATFGTVQLTANKNILPTGISNLALSPSTVQGGSSTLVTATLTLKGTMGTDTLVAITSSDPDHTSLPATLLIPAGQPTGSVVVTTASIIRITKATLTATRLGLSKSSVLTITS